MVIFVPIKIRNFHCFEHRCELHISLVKNMKSLVHLWHYNSIDTNLHLDSDQLAAIVRVVMITMPTL